MGASGFRAAIDEHSFGQPHRRDVREQLIIVLVSGPSISRDFVLDVADAARSTIRRGEDDIRLHRNLSSHAEMMSRFTFDHGSSPKRAPKPLSHEALEQIVHVDHEGLCFRGTVGVRQGQIGQDEPGKSQRRLVVAIQPVQRNGIDDFGADGCVVHVLERRQLMHEETPYIVGDARNA